MNKIFFILTLCLLVSYGNLFGQSLQQGDKIVNVGLGLVGLGLNVTGEYMISDEIGVGAFVAYERRTFSYLYTSLAGDYARNELTFGARAAYHAGKLIDLDPKFDPYVAAGLGINIYNDPYWTYNVGRNDWDGKSFVRPSFLFRLGARYHLSEKMAVFGDLGSGGSLFQGGISLKF